MKLILMVLLYAFAFSGCTPAALMQNTATPATSKAGEASDNSAETNPLMTMTATQKVESPQSKPQAITVRPPHVPIAPVQGTPGPMSALKTWTDSAMGVALDYPEDWSVSENNAGGANFTSPQGAVILVEVISSESALSGVRDCATLINSYGQTAEVCHDTASSTYRAIFKSLAKTPADWIMLTTVSQEQPVVFLQMLDSVRSIK